MACCLPQTDQRPASLWTAAPLETRNLPSSSTPVFTAECDVMALYGTEKPFSQLGSAFPGMSPPSLFFTPAYSLQEWSGKKWKLWHRASSLQQQPKLQRVSNTIVATNSKHSAIWAPMKKVNSIPDSVQYLNHLDHHYVNFSVAWRVSKMSSQSFSV